MDFPHFDLPRLGAGMLVAIVSIIHIAIAHTAVGAGFFIAIAHTWASRRGDKLMLDFLRRYSKYLVAIPFVAGTVTGVGIWVTIGLASPPATSALIHLFVWGWAMEWVFFILEIIAGYVYYYGWDRLTPSRHTKVAWLYFIGAYASLFIINGIVTFMLTPGTWKPPTELGAMSFQGAFWAAFLNPSFWPSLLLRTFSCLAFGGISVAVVANLTRDYTREQQQSVINFGSYLLAPIVLMVPCAAWYFHVLPEPSRRFALGGAIAMTLFLAFGVVSSVYIAGYTYFGLIRNKRYINMETSFLLLAVAFVATGSIEFLREGVRKPYLIYGYMYSNGILATPEWKGKINRDGILTYAHFARPPGVSATQVKTLPRIELGRCVFNAECRICHEPGGTNAIEPLINRSSRELVTKMMDELDHLKGYMPPFLGTPQEKAALVEYQLYLAEQARSGKSIQADAARPAVLAGSIGGPR